MNMIVSNKEFAQKQIEMSADTPVLNDLDFYEKLILEKAGSRVSLLVAACDLLEICKRSDPAYGLMELKRGLL